jgi:hypothetical protein
MNINMFLFFTILLNISVAFLFNNFFSWINIFLAGFVCCLLIVEYLQYGIRVDCIK